MTILFIFLLIIGFAALIKGADWFVEGSSALARIFHVPGVIIGLTIVALGTSAPELAVSTLAAVSGSNEIALSNVVGSNIFNLLCVLGVCAVIKPLPVASEINKRDFPISIGAAVLVMTATCLVAITEADFIKADMDDIRTPQSSIRGAYAMSRAKKQKVFKTALTYLQTFDLVRQPRFDVVDILGHWTIWEGQEIFVADQVHIIKGAFGSEVYDGFI